MDRIEEIVHMSSASKYSILDEEEDVEQHISDRSRAPNVSVEVDW
jgi:hypothetical protein